MQFKYVEIARLSVKQLFYKNKICRQFTTTPVPDLEIIPTENSQDIFKRMDLVFRKLDASGGFVVLGRVLGTNGAGNYLLRFPPKKDDVLSILVILKNPELQNFNDLPVQQANDSIFYFSNTVTDAAALRNNLHITKSASGVDATNDVIKKSSAIYRFHHSATVTNATVKHLVSGQTADANSIINQGGQSDLVFDLASFVPGKCELVIENVAQEQFYYTGNVPAKSVFGVIELFLSTTIDANYRIIEPDRSLTSERPVFTILFINRQTFWRYIVLLQTSSPLYLEIAALSPPDKADFLNKLNIVVANDTSVTFSKTNSTETQFVFESDNPLPLQEKYFSSTNVADVLNITLKKYIGDAVKEAAVKTNLPYPSTGSINNSVPPKIFSDIFLTI